MANIVNYELHIKGSRKACEFFVESYHCYEARIKRQKETKDGYIMHIVGELPWGVDARSNMEYKGNSLSDDEIDNLRAEENLNYNLKSKSKMLNCEIEIHAWCNDGDKTEEYYHFKDGEILHEEFVRITPEVNLEWWKEIFPTLEEYIDELKEKGEYYKVERYIEKNEFESMFEKAEDGCYTLYIPKTEKIKFKFDF